jgi:hypothetical protein
MAKPMTAEEILPLVTGLAPRERIRLLRLIAASASVGAAAAYAAFRLPDKRRPVLILGLLFGERFS